jgi:LemA protein
MIAIWATYNNLVSKRNQVDNAYGALDAMLKKRYDLLPNLISVVKIYMDHERTTLMDIATLSEKRDVDKINPEEKHDIDSKVGSTMNNILQQTSKYPGLKSDSQFSRLQASWNEAEEQIAAARRAYNSAVTEYNNAYEGFPGNMFAKNMNFAHKAVLETAEEEKQNISADSIFTS